MSEWISVNDRLPSLEGKPDYNCQELVMAYCGRHVVPRYYARKMYNKTEKGRMARWEDMLGRIVDSPTHWMPLPSPPEDSQ